MVAFDIQWFFQFLAGMTQIRGLFVAGSSWRITRNGTTGAAYLDRIIVEAWQQFGFALPKVKVFQKSGPRIAIYRLIRPQGEDIPVFFCGASPSSNSPDSLVHAVRQHALLLKQLGF